ATPTTCAASRRRKPALGPALVLGRASRRRGRQPCYARWLLHKLRRGAHSWNNVTTAVVAIGSPRSGRPVARRARTRLRWPRDCTTPDYHFVMRPLLCATASADSGFRVPKLGLVQLSVPFRLTGGPADVDRDDRIHGRALVQRSPR